MTSDTNQVFLLFVTQNTGDSKDRFVGAYTSEGTAIIDGIVGEFNDNCCGGVEILEELSDKLKEKLGDDFVRFSHDDPAIEECLDEIERSPAMLKMSSHRREYSEDYIVNAVRYVKLWRRVNLSGFKDVDAREWRKTRNAFLCLKEASDEHFVQFRVERHDLLTECAVLNTE